jgi:multimeric flavodoxin WrbA
MKNLAIVYYSETGNTGILAQQVAEGALSVAGVRTGVHIISANGTLEDADWTALDASDAIIFGTPTHMGGPAWQFKRFADDSGYRWLKQAWLDKVAGGFTCAGSPNGDKGTVMLYLATLAAQHGMLWVSLGQLPAQAEDSTPEDQNWVGGSLGPTATAPSKGLAAGDLLSARAYGARVAGVIAELL